MKKFSYFIFCILILFISCDENKNIRLLTANKLILYFDNSNIDSINNLITTNRTSRSDKNQIMNDCLFFNSLHITDNYSNLKYSYVENKADLVVPFKVVVPLFDGIDTIGNRRITKVTLDIDFGPEQVNNPHQIAGYKFNTEFTFTDSINSLKRPDSNYSPTEDSAND